MFAYRSKSRAVPRSTLAAMSTAILVTPAASLGRAASLRANAVTRSRNDSAGYTACTSPIVSASSAETSSPNASHLPQCGPTSRVTRLIPRIRVSRPG